MIDVYINTAIYKINIDIHCRLITTILMNYEALHISKAGCNVSTMYTMLYLPVCLSACLPVCLSVCLPFGQSACLPVCLSVCQPVCLFASLPVCQLSVCQFTSCLPACLPIWLFVSLPVC